MTARLEGVRRWLLLSVGFLLIGASTAVIAFAAGHAGNATPKPALGGKLPPRLPLSKGKTYFVDGAKGNDAARGTAARPWRSLNVALRRVPASGGQIVVRGGTYPGRYVFDRKVDPRNPVTLRAYSGERVVLTGGNPYEPALWIVRARGLRVRGLEFSAPLATSLRIENASDIEIVGNEIHHSGNHGVLVAGTGTGDGVGNRNIQFWGNRIHDNGGREGGYNIIGNHGIYYGGTSSNDDGVDRRSVGGVIANNVFYDQPYGRHLQIGSQVNGLIVTNNTFDNAYQEDTRAGKAIVIYAESNAFATSNVLVVNNVITHSRNYGVHGSSPQSLAANIVTNNLAFANAGNDFVNTWEQNVLYTLQEPNILGVDPRYVNRESKDFRLQAGSPALGRSLKAYTPPYDQRGLLRDPATPDLGAFETRGASPVVSR
jgi:hypothetical protein